MKRTRRLTRAQSKYGCLTCKARKVRCDETQPTCRRCTNAGFICEGYTNARPDSPSRNTANSSLANSAPAPVPSIGAHPPAIPKTELQQKLGKILQANNIVYIGHDTFDSLIERINQPAPSSLTAIPALEVLLQRDSDENLRIPESRLQVDTAYGRAIRLFADEIRQDTESSDAVFITGIILIAIELLQRRPHDAWKHLLGARQWLNSTTSIDPSLADIEFLYCIYDLQALLYSHNVRFPMVEPHDDNGLEYLDIEILSFTHLEKVIVNVLHNAHSLISGMHYSDLLGTLQQERQSKEEMYLADLRLSVQFIDRKIYVSSEPQKESAYLILRNLCLMTIIELEEVRSKAETGWDKHDEEFQCIIEAVEGIQRRSQEVAGPTEIPAQLHLTLQLGLIPPLLLTALKFRHPLWRRRATACLRKAGIEGPFIGKQLAAIAERCIDIEESGTRQPSVSTPEGPLSTTRLNVRMPTEDRRIAHCRTEEDNESPTQTSWPQTAKGATLVTFVARRIPESVLAVKVLTSSYFQTGEEYHSFQDREVDDTVWRAWTETVQFNGSAE